jgi:hypothetical protein
MRRRAFLLAVLLAMAGPATSPARADDPRAEAATICSNGICTRIDRLTLGREGRREDGWGGDEAWRGRGFGLWVGEENRRARPNRPRRDRDDDDDDDDDD